MKNNTSEAPRILLIIKKLSESDYQEMCCEQLANYFDVDTRTMRRDLKKLMENGYPLNESIGRHGIKFYSLRAKEPIRFEYDEVAALCLCRPYLAPLEGTFLGDAAEQALKKLRNQLSDKEFENLEKLLGIFGQPETANIIKPMENTYILGELINGCEDRCEVRITYRSLSAKDEETYLIKPYELVNNGGVIYINGYSCKSHDIRQWKLSRMINAEKTRVKFERPSSFHFEQFSSPDKKKQHIVVRFAPAVAQLILERKWHDSEKLTENSDGSIIAEYNLAPTILLKNRILSYGANAEILEPASLRRELKDCIEQMRNLYQK